jgi:hypothetical protein
MAELLERWPETVGASIARNAWPARIARDGTVHVHTADSIWAFELGQRAGEIAERLGVPKVRFVPGPLPEPDEEAGPPPLEPSTADVDRARSMTAGIRDGNLRETVQRAVSFGLARAARDRPV